MGRMSDAALGIILLIVGIPAAILLVFILDGLFAEGWLYMTLTQMIPPEFLFTTGFLLVGIVILTFISAIAFGRTQSMVYNYKPPKRNW
jgi:hypothetical protein